MMCTGKFDERQLRIRGDVFMHGFLLLGLLLFIDAFLIDDGIVWVEGMWANILIIMLSTTVCSIEMILRDVYTTRNKRSDIVPYAFGILSLIMLVNNVIDFIGGKSFISNHKLSHNGVYIVFNIFMALIFFAFVIMKVYHRHEARESITQ